MSIRIIIVDDHEVVRSGIKMLLDNVDDIEVVGEGSSGEDAIKLAEDLDPDVIVMDVSMPGMGGIEATQLIKQKMPDVQILALTIHEGQEYFFKMLHAGASGYVPKRAASNILIEAIHQVAKGYAFIEAKITRLLVTDYVERVREGGEAASFDGLTEREQEILTHIAEDYTNQEIANMLNISVKTVERHRENIMSKLGLHTRIELVKYAIRKGMISVTD